MMDKLQSIDEVSDYESEKGSSSSSSSSEDFADNDSEVSTDTESDYDEGTGDSEEANGDILRPEKLLKQNKKLIKKLRKAKKVDVLLDEYIRSTVLCRLVHNGVGVAYANSHVALGEAYLEVKKYPVQCLNHCQKALQILSSSTSPPLLEPAILCNCMIHYNSSRALAKQKKYKLAEKEILKAEKFFEEWSRQSQPTDTEIDAMELKIANIASKLYLILGNVPAAETYFLKCKELVERNHGNSCTELISILQNLGKLEQSRKSKCDNDKALNYFTEAHTIATEFEGNDRLLSASTAHSLATAYSNINEIDAQLSAESYLNEAIAAYQLHFGPDHELTICCCDDLVRVLVRADRPAEAVAALRDSMAARCRVYGDASPQVVHAYHLLGSLYQAAGDTNRCIKTLQKSYAMQVMLTGSKHESAKQLKNTLNMLLALVRTPRTRQST